MPRRLTPFLSGLYYHIYNRGNNRQCIFFHPENYLYFLRGIKKYVCPLATVVAYCLMPTHYHLLLRIKSALMRLSVSYTKAINKRFERVGSLFQGPFQANSDLLSSAQFMRLYSRQSCEEWSGRFARRLDLLELPSCSRRRPRRGYYQVIAPRAALRA